MSSRKSLSSTDSIIFLLRSSFYKTDQLKNAALRLRHFISNFPQDLYLLLLKIERLTRPAVGDHVIYPQVLQLFPGQKPWVSSPDFSSWLRRIVNLLLHVLCQNP